MLSPTARSADSPARFEAVAARAAPSARPDAFAATDWRRWLQRYLHHLTVECGLAANTLEAYGRDLREFVDVLDDRDICAPANVTPLVVRAYLVRLSERKLALSSIARHLVSVRMFLRYLYVAGVLTEDVAALLETPRKWLKLPRTLRQAQVDALLNSPEPGDPLYARDRAILETLYAAGLRVSELARLRADDVNLEVGYLRCLGKGGRERIVPIGSQAIQAIREYARSLRPMLVESEHGPSNLFVTRTGRGMDRTNIWRLVQRYARAAGIEGPVGPHTLRHCFATHLIEGGADLRIVQELLGHVDVSTTQIYLHLDPSRLKSIHQKCHPRQ